MSIHYLRLTYLKWLFAVMDNRVALAYMDMMPLLLFMSINVAVRRRARDKSAECQGVVVVDEGGWPIDRSCGQ